MRYKRRTAPQRRRGETAGSARKRWRKTGACQGCGKKKNTKGALCGRCLFKKKQRYSPRERSF